MSEATWGPGYASSGLATWNPRRSAAWLMPELALVSTVAPMVMAEAGWTASYPRSALVFGQVCSHCDQILGDVDDGQFSAATCIASKVLLRSRIPTTTRDVGTRSQAYGSELTLHSTSHADPGVSRSDSTRRLRPHPRLPARAGVGRRTTGLVSARVGCRRCYRPCRRGAPERCRRGRHDGRSRR